MTITVCCMCNWHLLLFFKHTVLSVVRYLYLIIWYWIYFCCYAQMNVLKWTLILVVSLSPSHGIVHLYNSVQCVPTGNILYTHTHRLQFFFLLHGPKTSNFTWRGSSICSNSEVYLQTCCLYLSNSCLVAQIKPSVFTICCDYHGIK